MCPFIRLCLLACILRPGSVVATDPLDLSELQLLYAADLAVDARYVREDEAHVWVRVAAVLNDRGFGIASGDHLRVDKAASYDCGFSWNRGDQRRWRLYLQKEQGKGHWALSRHNAGSAIPFIHGRAILHMPAWVELPIAEFDRCLIELRTCYASADSGHTFTAVCDQRHIDSLAVHNAILAQFEKQGRSVTAAHLFEPPVMPVAEPAPAPIRDCALLEQRPRREGAAVEFLLPDPTPDALGPGKVVLGALIDAEGMVHEATILRGSTPQRDAEALRAIAGISRVEPGSDRGVPAACHEVFLVRFQMPEE